MYIRANQKINANDTHTVPSTADNVQLDTSNITHSGPHLSSRHTCKPVTGSNSTLMNTVTQIHRHAWPCTRMAVGPMRLAMTAIAKPAAPTSAAAMQSFL